MQGCSRLEGLIGDAAPMCQSLGQRQSEYEREGEVILQILETRQKRNLWMSQERCRFMLEIDGRYFSTAYMGSSSFVGGCKSSRRSRDSQVKTIDRSAELNAKLRCVGSSDRYARFSQWTNSASRCKEDRDFWDDGLGRRVVSQWRVDVETLRIPRTKSAHVNSSGTLLSLYKRSPLLWRLYWDYRP